MALHATPSAQDVQSEEALNQEQVTIAVKPAFRLQVLEFSRRELSF
jgi:hypothetical protein